MDHKRATAIKLMHGWLPTYSKLAKQQREDTTTCPKCDNHEEIQHHIFTCPNKEAKEVKGKSLENLHYGNGTKSLHSPNHYHQCMGEASQKFTQFTWHLKTTWSYTPFHKDATVGRESRMQPGRHKLAPLHQRNVPRRLDKTTMAPR